MGIEIARLSLAELLYNLVSAQAHQLTLGERLALFQAMKARRGFATLDRRLQQAFEAVGAQLRARGITEAT